MHDADDPARRNAVDVDRTDAGAAEESQLARRRRPRTTAEQVADACGLMIVEGRFAPGERLGEERLADIFQVSRGPVREAFRILEKRRLVEIIPRRGAFARLVTLSSIADLFNVRNALAAMAAGTMARRLDPAAPGDAHARLLRRVERVHAMAADPDCDPMEFAVQLTRVIYAVVAGSGNELLDDIWSELNENTFWTVIWESPQDSLTAAGRRARAGQIDALVAAISQGDAPAAEHATREVLDQIRDKVLANLQASRPSGIA